MIRKALNAVVSCFTSPCFDYQWLDKWFKALQYNHHQLLQEVEIMAQELDDLKAQVAQNISIEKSAVDLIKGLADRITASAGDPQALAQLSADLHVEADELSKAITANTPAAPTTTTEPPSTSTTEAPANPG